MSQALRLRHSRSWRMLFDRAAERRAFRERAVQNVRATNGAAYLQRISRRPVLLTEVPLGERAPILKAWCRIATSGPRHLCPTMLRSRRSKRLLPTIPFFASTRSAPTTLPRCRLRLRSGTVAPSFRTCRPFAKRLPLAAMSAHRTARSTSTRPSSRYGITCEGLVHCCG